jgi:hypothetical protein
VTSLEKIYFICWTASLGAALIMAARLRFRLTLFSPEYGKLLARPWRLTSFFLAFAGIVIIAPYTGDPTWDYADAGLMAGLTFLTAPWALGTLWRGLRRREGTSSIFIALNLWMLSSAWIYDGYLLWRDGIYPASWLANVPASSCLYAAAGLFWNLSWRPGRGTYFLFTEETWPTEPGPAKFAKLAWAAAIFALVAAGLILPFLWGGWG